MHEVEQRAPCPRAHACACSRWRACCPADVRAARDRTVPRPRAPGRLRVPAAAPSRPQQAQRGAARPAPRQPPDGDAVSGFQELFSHCRLGAEATLVAKGLRGGRPALGVLHGLGGVGGPGVLAGVEDAQGLRPRCIRAATCARACGPGGCLLARLRAGGGRGWGGGSGAAGGADIHPIPTALHRPPVCAKPRTKSFETWI